MSERKGGSRVMGREGARLKCKWQGRGAGTVFVLKFFDYYMSYWISYRIFCWGGGVREWRGGVAAIL